ncbi:MAG: aminotransferase class I/II-fold pyridoxal phosphate-dependent enzyme [Chloroflexia bacterium]|nr:aminotransferase class I/II-fold pyridoxal phosphate-dependent enzyme [Chloroflexia bacterium]
MIDLRSDTVTRPTPEMRAAMAESFVGDDQYGEDPTVNRLEAMAAQLLGKEAAVYVPSGTMGNLSALLAHCGRGDEALVGDESHILWFESGGPSTLGGIPLFALKTDRRGRLDPADIVNAIRSDRPGYPKTGVLCLENTHNRCGGVVLDLEYMRQVREIARDRGVPIHLDGARIFNAAAFLGVPAAVVAAEVDSVQFCLSKGLGAPVGSLVAGTEAFIQNVRKQRKVLGGAMRQSGVIAAAGVVAFETMIERLPEDHARAQTLADGLAAIDGIRIDRESVQTNIVVFKLEGEQDHAAFIAGLKERGLLVSNYGLRGVRMVTHYEIDDAAIASALGFVKAAMAGMRETVRVPA